MLYTRIKYILNIILLPIVFLGCCYAADKKDIKIDIIDFKEIKKSKSNIYIHSKKDSIYISSKNKLYAIKKNKILWEKTISGKISKKISITKDIIIITTENRNILAINPKNGDILWKTKTNDEILSKAKITNNNIYINTNGNEIIALDKYNGRLLWNLSIDNQDMNLYYGHTPIISKNIIYNIFSNNKLIAIKKENGQLIWKKKIFKNNNNSITNVIRNSILYNNKLYINNNSGNLINFDLNDKKVIFEKKFKEKINININKENIIITKNNGTIINKDIKTNQNIWKNKELKNKKLTYPIIFKKNEIIIIGDDIGMIHFINLNTGKIIKSIKISKYSINKCISNKDKHIYIITNKKHVLYAKIKY